MSQPRFAECDWSVFISYAFADVNEYRGWITNFGKVIDRDLAPMISRRIRNESQMLPVPHLAGVNGPYKGELDDELRSRVRKSFAMVIVVGKYYVDSEWCLKELGHFKTHFGDAGINARLYVCALDKGSFDRLRQKPEWRTLLGTGREQTRIEFFKFEFGQSETIPVFPGGDSETPTSEFDAVYKRSIKQDLERMIEADLIEPPPAQNVRWLIGLATPEIRRATDDFADQLRAKDPSVWVLTDRDNRKERFRLASRLILPIDFSQPLENDVVGGHLSRQVALWQATHPDEPEVHFLDLRQAASAGAAVPAAPDQEHVAELNRLLAEAHPPAALMDRLFPPPSAVSTAGSHKLAKLFIESSTDALDEWHLLKPDIEQRWATGLGASQATISLRPKGLDFVNSPQFDPREADGLILLWPNRTEATVLAKVNAVENRLANDVVPSIIAYLRPPNTDEGDRPAVLWDTLSFNRSDPPEPYRYVAGTPRSLDQLEKFLKCVLEHAQQRNGG